MYNIISNANIVHEYEKRNKKSPGIPGPVAKYCEKDGLNLRGGFAFGRGIRFRRCVGDLFRTVRNRPQLGKYFLLFGVGKSALGKLVGEAANVFADVFEGVGHLCKCLLELLFCGHNGVFKVLDFFQNLGLICVNVDCYEAHRAKVVKSRAYHQNIPPQIRVKIAVTTNQNRFAKALVSGVKLPALLLLGQKDRATRPIIITM